jgi:cAMP-binding proteins - catabolite gene activator and regulatory subunit of cAMP-dependent protein kinases
MPVIQALKSCPLFTGYPEPGLLMIAKIARNRPVTAQTPIVVENMVAESMYIVKNGIVQLSVRAMDGRDIVLEQLAPGEFFGEMSLLIGGHRMVTATAKTDCELIEIMRRDFIKLQNQKPQACFKLVISIINQFSKKLTGCREYLKTLMVAGFSGIDT